jgi:RimJ/RimL family protein N-acetyltransferase
MVCGCGVRAGTTNYWQGERVCLRAIEPSDAETFFRWNQDSQRARYLDFVWPPTSLASVQAWVGDMTRRKLEGDVYRWVITDRAGTPVGSIDTHHCDARTGTFSYGVDIAAEERRKGYASEAIRMVLRYYFHELRYQKVTVSVHSDNIPSARLHEKLGFQREGTLRRMVYSEGRYYDETWYGMTREEFESGERVP